MGAARRAEPCHASLSLQPAQGNSGCATTPAPAAGQLVRPLAHPSFYTWGN